MPRIEILFFDAGGGHRSAATSLELSLRRLEPDWQVELVNLQDTLDAVDFFRRFTGVRLSDIYNRMIKRGWTWGFQYLLPLLHQIIRLRHRPAARLLEKRWRQTRPDLVVSVVPNLNRTLYEGLRAASATTPYVTILTDLADNPPHFWMEPGQDQYFICGTGAAVEQAQRMGYTPERIFLASGMILHPRFYEPVEKDRATERSRLGLDPDKVTGLVLFGGQGSRDMVEIARRLDASPLDVQLILICGHNERVAAELRSMKTRKPMLVEGFTTEIPYYMYLADFFIGKPGPGSISEALAMKLPVIVEKNPRTIPQERFNAEWVEREELGVVVRSFREIVPAVEHLLAPERFARLRDNAGRIRNRAVLEIPSFLVEILKMGTPDD